MAQIQINDTMSDASVVVDLDFNINPVGDNSWSASSGDENVLGVNLGAGVVSAKRTSTPIRRTGFPVRAKAWAGRDRKRMHKPFFILYQPKKFLHAEASPENFQKSDDHFRQPFLFI